jgi:phosphatidate phosphatase LPIN
MFAVEALSSYISRGVSTVSSPFHPFGGAVDIVVVEQQDGSYESSPWYVRFGKFQGVLKAKEKVVNISVNGVEADFHMYLDHAGVAYFLREVDAGEMTSMLWPSPSDLQADDRVSLRSKSCIYEVGQSSSVTKTDVSTQKFVSRTRPDGSQVLGIVFESQSMKEVRYSNSEDKDTATYSLEGEEKKDNVVDDLVVSSEFEKTGKSAELTRVEILCSTSEISPLSNSGIVDNISNDELNLQISRKIAELGGAEVNPCDDMSGAKIVCLETSRIGNCEVSVKATTQQIPAVNIQPEMESKESSGDENCCKSFSNSRVVEDDDSSSKTKNVVTETYSEKITVHPINGSVNEVDSCNITTISKSKSFRVAQDDSKPDYSQEADEIKISRPNTPDEEEEQFLFSEDDEFKPKEAKKAEPISVHRQDQENPNSLLSSGVESANESFSSDPPQNVEVDKPIKVDRSISSRIDIPRSSKASSQEVGCMVESLPTVLSVFDDLDTQDVQSLLTHSLDSNSKTSKWLLIRKDVAKCIKSARDEERCSSAKKSSITDDEKISEDLANANAGATVGGSSKVTTASGGSWRLWPFLSRTKKVTEVPPAKVSEPDPSKVTEPDTNKVTEPNSDKVIEPGPSKVTESGPTCVEDKSNGENSECGKKEVPKEEEKFRKHTVRANTPTSEQLMSLNLKEGRNTITFTFLTSMLGEQMVDATIYLWRWDARIVISDVDGTITKSDILGQFMPLMGKDWSHTGVVHLFNAIKENGYHMLYLSARSISQAYLTRQFLFNLKQDGVDLPDGPVVISPDGLFPSLFREVIRRAPHEFKIACLEDIKALFPKDRNPFYAGFWEQRY